VWDADKVRDDVRDRAGSSSKADALTDEERVSLVA
jgi:hypothetical protein